MIMGSSPLEEKKRKKRARAWTGKGQALRTDLVVLVVFL
jgi:hypothetical protein